MQSLGVTHSRAKVKPADIPPFAMRRPRLERLIDEGTTRRLTLVVAPAGYGKSVLLAQWASDQQDRRVAWLSIDERDTDAARLGSHLVAAIAGVHQGIGDAALRMLSAGSSRLGDGFVSHLLEDLQTIEDDLVVMIDELDLLDGASTEDLGRLIAEAPQRVHFVVACRADPGIPAHRLRSRGDLVELRARDLRFTPPEAKDIVERLNGHALTDAELTHLVGLTEGWPVAICLAAVSLRNTDAARQLIEFSGSDRSVVDYLSAELLAREAPEVRAVLLDISVLSEFNGELCDAITGRDDGARMLATMERRALFVERVPDEPGWYRLHRLVREFLRHDLQSADSARPARLLERASDWWLDRDEQASAATYLIAARSWDRLIELVDQYGRSAWSQGAAREVLAWMSAIPEPVWRPNVRLRLTRGALEVITGAGSRAAREIDDLECELELTEGEQVLADLIACAVVVLSYPHDDMLARADRALEAVRRIPRSELPNVLIDTDLHSISAQLSAMAACGRLLFGHGSAFDLVHGSLEVREETLAVCRVNLLGMLALLEALAGRSSRSVAASGLAADLTGADLSGDHPATIFWRAALAVDARMRDDLDGAAEAAAGALDVAIRWRRWPLAAFLLAEQGLIELARGSPDVALGHVRRCSQLPTPAQGPMVEGRLRSVELRARLASGENLDVRSAVDAGSMGSSWELAGSAVHAALSSGYVDWARKYLDAWPAVSAPLGELEHELCTALVELSEGSVDMARERVHALLLASDFEGALRPFIDGGEPVILLLEDLARHRPGRRVEALLERARRARPSLAALVEPLSAREIEVLQYLPSRMSNADIAAALFVSTNTIKTHVKHIYQKLAAVDRDDAVLVARAQGLL